MNKNNQLIESLIADINDRLQNHTMTLEQANLLESQKKLLQNLLISTIDKDDMDINDLNIIEDISNELLDNDCDSEVLKEIPDEIKLKQKDYIIIECKSCLRSIIDEISFLNSTNFELNDDSKKLLTQCIEDYLFLSKNFLDVIYDNVLYFERLDKAKSIFDKYLNYQTDHKIDSKRLNHDELKNVVEKAKEQFPAYAAKAKDKEEKRENDKNAFDHKLRMIEQKDLKPTFDYGPRLDYESKNKEEKNNKKLWEHVEKIAKEAGNFSEWKKSDLKNFNPEDKKFETKEQRSEYRKNLVEKINNQSHLKSYDDFDDCKMESLICDFDNDNYDLEIYGANSQLEAQTVIDMFRLMLNERKYRLSLDREISIKPCKNEIFDKMLSKPKFVITVK